VNAARDKKAILQAFLNNGEQLRHPGSDFARRRSGVRIPSAPLRKSTYLQVNYAKHEEAPECIRGFLLQPYCNPFLPQRVLKGAGRAILHGGQYVGVGIQGYGYGGVPQHLGDYLGVDVPR
jgi:hypothetical protein